MRRLALLCAVLGVAALAAGGVLGLLGVEIEVAGRTYDCGSSLGRLGGDDAETAWQEESFLLTAPSWGRSNPRTSRRWPARTRRTTA